jgi:succinate dehydrogenase / fumarate reductase membrane anchor subunit
VPLTLWFVFSLVSFAGAPYAEVRAWAGHPVTATLLLAVILTTFHHMHLGVQTVAEDYIHTDAIRLVVVLGVKALALLLGLASFMAVLKLAFTG